MKKKEGKSIPFKNLLLGHESTDSVYGLLVYSLHGPSEMPAWFILSCPCICADKGGCLLTSFLQSPKKLLHTQVMSHWKVKLLSCNDLSWLKMRRIFHIVRTWLSMKCASQKLMQFYMSWGLFLFMLALILQNSADQTQKILQICNCAASSGTTEKRSKMKFRHFWKFCTSYD